MPATYGRSFEPVFQTNKKNRRKDGSFYWRELLVTLRTEYYAEIMEIGELRKYFPEVSKLAQMVT